MRSWKWGDYYNLNPDGTIGGQELQYGIAEGESNLFTLVDWDGDGLRGQLKFSDCDNKANYEEGDRQYQVGIRIFDGDLGWIQAPLLH